MRGRPLSGRPLSGRPLHGRLLSQRSYRSGGRAPAFSPLSLSPLAWYEPSDQSTLFQERTGASATTPSVVDGVVGTMLDKSGNGHHVVAPSDAARPILRNSGSLYWLESDGVNDALAVTYGGNLNQPWDRVSAFRRLSAATGVQFVGGAGDNIGALYVEVGTEAELRIFSGSEVSGLIAPANGVDFVATERHNGASSRVAIDNGSYQTGNAGATAATGLTIGAGVGGTSNFANCRCYGVVQMDRSLTDPEIAQLRTYFAAKQGRAL